MRYNVRELLCLSKQPAEKAAELTMRGPKRNDAAKCRLVKLVVNFLFYFRIDEEEPVGALLLEQCRIQKEDDTGFSLAFVDEPERKYSFTCETKDECEEWIEALTKASYEYMRQSLIFYRNEIKKITGKELADIQNAGEVDAKMLDSFLKQVAYFRCTWRNEQRTECLP